MSDPDGLPAEVVQALDISAVLAIRTFQDISGLGLYEAKLAVDAYLERHPEHALPQRSASSSVAPRGEKAGAMLDDFATAEPVPAEAPVFDSLVRVVATPGLYVLLREGVPCKEWFGEALKAFVDAGFDTARIEIIDEERRNGNGDLSAAVLKLSGALSNEALCALPETLGRRLAEGISFRLVRAVQWSEAAIPTDELELEFFLHEFSRQSPMVWKTTSSVRLRHRTTGILCRSTAHRRRATNYQEALLLLASLLKECR
ncbi:MAG: hypothetical protein Q8N13_01290 [Acidovorax sp.]|nr:hypothetical protein [Acidovorax sp.]